MLALKVNLDPLARPGGVLRKKITLKSAFLESITCRTVLKINIFSIIIFLKIFISQGLILKIEVLMTLNDVD